VLDILLIFFAGFFGSTLILFLKKYHEEFNDNIFLFLKLFSAGIILGTGCIHMLPDSRTMFEESNLTNYPYADFIFGLSIILIMALEEVVNRYFHKSKENHHVNDNLHANNISLTDIELQNHPAGEHCHTVNIVYQQDPNLKKLITLYILEFGMAFHSVIIGLALGTSSNYNVLISLSIAINFHQLFEGVALGSAISQCIDGLTWIKIFIIVLCYSLTTPLGIGVGMAVSSDSHSTFLQGIFNAVSAGILVYMATIHFIIEDYINNEATGFKKFLMFLSLGCGYAVMAIIGIFA
jgi:zinc transporter 1/2/3